MAFRPVSGLLFLGVVLATLPGMESTTTFDDDGTTGSEYSGFVPDLGPPETTTTSLEEDPGPKCDPEGQSAHYLEILSGTGSTMLRKAGSQTGCPNHVNWPLNGFDAKEFATAASIPAYPMLFADDATTDLSTIEGQVGILLNGVAQFSAYSTGPRRSFEASAFVVEQASIDLCGGLSTEEGWYHHYSTPGCLQEQAMLASGTTTKEHSPQIGWAYACDESGADETYCLDSCMGYAGSLAVDEFMYRYYTSCGTDEAFFPLTLNCYRGCCPDGLTCNSPVENCGASPVDGFTSSYVPKEAADLSEVYDAELIEGDDARYINSTSSLDCSLYLGNGTVAIETGGASSSSTFNLVIFSVAVLAGSLAILGV